MAIRPLILAAALFLAIPFCASPAAEPPSLDELLKLYKDLGLPLPPKDAKLVRFDWSERERINGKTERKNYHSLAFQIGPATASDGPLLLRGASEWRPESGAKIKPVPPEASAADGITIHFPEAILFAAQCQSRGWNKLAQRVVDVSQQDRKDSPREILIRQAWYYWEEQISKPKIDRTPAAKHLKQIIGLDKSLDTPEHRALLKSLELALVPSKAKPGSIEAMIDDLVNLCADEDPPDFVNLWRPDMQMSALAKLGFDAVPALIEHVDDDRLTRFLAHGGLNLSLLWFHHYRVGEVVSEMIEDLIGHPVIDDWDLDMEGVKLDKAKVRKWYQEARKVGEERYVVDHVLVPIKAEPRLAFINMTHLSLICNKYPKHLPAIYRKILDQYPKTEPVMPHVIRVSKLPDNEKLTLLSLGAKNPESLQRCAALSILQEIDKQQFDLLLPGAVETLPADVGPWEAGGPVELDFVLFAERCDNPRIWPVVEQVIRKAKVGFRVMMLQRFGSADKVHPKRRERMRLLASFLDDAAVYDRAENDKRNPGFEPSAYPKLEVRNFVALRLAEMLGMKVETNPKRTPDEWAKLRAKVRVELKRAEKK